MFTHLYSKNVYKVLSKPAWISQQICFEEATTRIKTVYGWYVQTMALNTDDMPIATANHIKESTAKQP